jgi:hypothetical protein
MRLAEDVRVAADELIRQPCGHLVEAEVAALLADLCLEEHLQQNVAELLGMRIARLPVHHLQEFVALLDQAWLEGRERLLPIPRAAAGAAQARQNRAQAVDSRFRRRGGGRAGGAVRVGWVVA